MSQICVVLQNPSPTGLRSISRRNVEIAASVLGHDSVELVNLLETESRNSRELEALRPSSGAWVSSRPALEQALQRSDEILFGWGQTRLGRGLEPERLDQILWVRERARELGHSHAWSVGDTARHPSRWRQYLGPVRGLYTGETFQERLHEALLSRPV